MDNLEIPSRENELDDLAVVLEEGVNGGVYFGYPATHEDYQAVIALYDEYGIDQTGLHADLLSTVKSGYKKTQKNGALKHIRGDILANANRCPICGIGPANELDHYVPQSDLEIFTVFVRNLVPICHECNTSKGSYTPAAPNERFVHAYYDPLPEQHLSVDVSIVNEGLLTSYGVPEFLDEVAQIGERVSFQLERLKLSDRWSDEVINYLSAHEAAFETVFESLGAEGVSTFLGAQAGKEEVRFGLSNWRPVLLRALSSDAEFCDGGFKIVLKF